MRGVALFEVAIEVAQHDELVLDRGKVVLVEQRRQRPDDGLAASILNFDVHFPAALSLRDSPMPELMKAAPEMELFIAGGMYDDLLPCAVGAEMARRDLVKSSDRVRSKCYAGGHMMYDEESQATLLSNDVRTFMRAALQGDPTRGTAVTP